MNIEQNKELLGSEVRLFSKKKQLKGTKWGFERLTKLAGTPLTNETITWENTKDEELNISISVVDHFPHPLCIEKSKLEQEEIKRCEF